MANPTTTANGDTVAVETDTCDSNNNGKPRFVSPEYDIPFETYLNLYHGVEDLDPSKITHYTEQTPEQKATYESFVERVRQFDFKKEVLDNDGSETPLVLPDDMTCLRFLQADKYDADKAFARIISTLKWQQTWKLAQVMSTPPAKLATYRKIRIRGCMGRTMDGMPIFVERMGAMFNGIPSKEGKSLTSDEWVQCFLYELADVLQNIRDNYKVTTVDHPEQPTTWRATWVMDFKGISAFKAMRAVSTIKLLDSVTEPNFPELAGTVYLINVPSLVSGVWKICKAFLDATVLEKIQVHSGVPKELLLERIPQEVLFEEYGGTNKGEWPKSEYI